MVRLDHCEADRFIEGKRDLPSAARAPVMSRQRERRSARREAGPFQQIVAFGAIGALLLYFARRPKVLGQISAVAVVGLTGAFAVWYFMQNHPSKSQTTPETPTVETRSTPARSREEASPATAVAPKSRADSEASTLAKPSRLSGSAVAQRDPAIDEWLTAAYLHCWTQPSAPAGGDYAAQIRVNHNVDGALTGAPVLVNPPSDPAWRAFADSALQAVKKCSPLRIPPKYAASYGQWKKVTLHFSPDNARD